MLFRVPECLQVKSTGWRRLIGSPKLRIILHKRATKYRSLLQKMTYKDKGSYESSPPCITYTSLRYVVQTGAKSLEVSSGATSAPPMHIKNMYKIHYKREEHMHERNPTRGGRLQRAIVATYIYHNSTHHSNITYNSNMLQDTYTARLRMRRLGWRLIGGES